MSLMNMHIRFHVYFTQCLSLMRMSAMPISPSAYPMRAATFDATAANTENWGPPGSLVDGS